MPPYTPVKSKAQARKMFVLAKEGKISEADARGKVRTAPQGLPERVGDRAGKKKKGDRRSAGKRMHARGDRRSR